MNGQEDLLKRLTSIYIVSGSRKSGSKSCQVTSAKFIVHAQVDKCSSWISCSFFSMTTIFIAIKVQVRTGLEWNAKGLRFQRSSICGIYSFLKDYRSIPENNVNCCCDGPTVKKSKSCMLTC